MGSVLLKILNAGGVGGALREVTNMIVALVGGKIPEKAILVAGMVLAVLIGTLGYKYIKLVAAAVLGGVGYAVGLYGFRFIEGRLGFNLPNIADYLIGAVVLVLLGYLAYKKFTYALFMIAGAFGFLVGYFIYPNYFVGAACAVVVAMVAMCFIRYGFVTILSVCAGFLFMGMLSAWLPGIRLLSLSEGFVGRILALILAAAFAAIQLYLSRGEVKKFASKGVKRVKVRRVYDSW